MLRHAWYKRHLIILPPPKKSIFWGVGFLRYLHEFLVWRQTVWHGDFMGQVGIFGRSIGRFRPILIDLQALVFQKIGIFCLKLAYFLQFFVVRVSDTQCLFSCQSIWHMACIGHFVICDRPFGRFRPIMADSQALEWHKNASFS